LNRPGIEDLIEAAVARALAGIREEIAALRRLLPRQRGSRRPGRPPNTNHPFPAALRKKGSTTARWAAEHGLSYATAKSWHAEGNGARAIPRRFAELIAREFGLPADETTWRNGITEKGRRPP
jgi:lambda repressor-like predicted transcriptional regulator